MTAPESPAEAGLAVPPGVLSPQELAHWQARASAVADAERRAARLHEAASAAFRKARADGLAQGRAEGMETGARLLCEAATALRATEAALTEEIGVIALAVVRRLLGGIEETRLLPALVRTALDARTEERAARLRVPPHWALRLAALELGVTVVPDPALRPGECLLDLDNGVREIGVEAQLAAIEAAFHAARAPCAEEAA